MAKIELSAVDAVSLDRAQAGVQQAREGLRAAEYSAMQVLVGILVDAGREEAEAEYDWRVVTEEKRAFLVGGPNGNPDPEQSD